MIVPYRVRFEDRFSDPENDRFWTNIWLISEH
ncbi:hypothetical protein C497_16062 [Halalkalicoccus jeotgali B3]|uniref:Uncharacterized protein n=1 Tax=Halalkalicoccus jeotgali (strain DSM 18796 / CECT 7217 / JCM 14584 / KCTC 4019 / B3) TaxID=795797 RepID=D8J7E7_HALJB|nr:hypothetical protein HacjB3_03245 [Halalkalicoccus jeotgali B3]ELY33914.1 hypothetical protein C497_16062 [Halalkalicoccus jeotgali B3]